MLEFEEQMFSIQPCTCYPRIKNCTVILSHVVLLTKPQIYQSSLQIIAMQPLSLLRAVGVFRETTSAEAVFAG